MAIALPLNFAWELLQAPAYGPMGDTWPEGLLVCARATLGDGVIFLALFGVGRVLFGRLWFAPPRIGRYAVVLVVAVVIQIAANGQRSQPAAGIMRRGTRESWMLGSCRSSKPLCSFR